MSTILNTNGAALQVPRLNENIRGKFYVITADWNPDVTYSLRDAAVTTLIEAGVEKSRIVSLTVPGTVELVNAAAAAIKAAGKENPPGGVIVIGCVIRGDTPHFDYVCQIAAQGVARINAAGDTPVIFGVLTVENQQQALDRAGGRLGNKGAEAACAAVTMANLHGQL